MNAGILKVYKELRIYMASTKLMEEILMEQKEYVSVMIDKEKEYLLDKEIKYVHQHFLKLKKKWKELYNLIDEVCYSSLTDIERIVFQEYFMNDLLAEQIQNKYNISISSVYNTATKINHQLNRINPSKYFVPIIRKGK